VTIRVVPLGGLGEIGMNCMAIELGEGGRAPIVVVDCGVMFPATENGVDVIHPDFSYLEANRERVLGLIVTHGHEDHIGAIPYLLRRFDVPVHAPPYALGLIRERLKEHAEHPAATRAVRQPRLVPTHPRTAFTLGAGGSLVEIEPIRVTHSIADATALAIRSDEGIVVHTGDFKIDDDPTDGEHFDRIRLKALGDEGVSLLLSDSTNVDSPGRSRGEREVGHALLRLIDAAPHRVFVALFASNVHRLRAMADIARATGRKIALLGRSVQTHMRVAHETGYLAVPPDVLVSIDDAATIPRERLLVVATGSQAEARSALARLALDDHPRLRIEPGDTAILSSRAIPGNEVNVMRMVGDLYRRGCVVHIKSSDPDIHTSGHAHRDEQRAMIDLVRPASFVPVHGTRHHLERHAALAREAGVRDVLVVENGEICDRDEARGLSKAGVTHVGKVSVDTAGELAEVVMRDRTLLGALGVVAVAVVVDERGRPVQKPGIATRGALDEAMQWVALDEAQREVFSTLETHPWTSERPSDDEVREVSRLAARRAIARHIGHKPITLAIVLHHAEEPG
jgi:ribonuclease J